MPLLSVVGSAAILAIRAAIARLRRALARRRSRSEAARHEEAGQIDDGQVDDGQVEDGEWVPHTLSFRSRLLDIEREAMAALRQVGGLAARHRVRLQIAIQPELSVRADAAGFRRALIGLLENAIFQAPGGKVLVGGMRHGGRIQIAVLDDGGGASRPEQAAALRSVEQIVALHGGTLQIENRPGQGTLVVLRLPEPLAAPAARSVDPVRQKPRDPAPSPTAAAEAGSG